MTDIRDKIRKTLTDHSEGLTILEIAKFIGVHRHTATKYVYELIGSRTIFERRIGNAKLCYLSESAVAKRLARRSSK
jgi:response regulator of citrate/malate metabolism